MDKVIYQLHFIYINDINSTQFHIVCSLFVTISIIQIHIFHAYSRRKNFYFTVCYHSKYFNYL